MRPLVDTHAHLNFFDYSADWRQVLWQSLDEGIFAINIGVNFESSEAAVKIAQNYENGVWAAIGLHPENIGIDSRLDGDSRQKPENIKEPEFDANKYRALALSSKKIVAIGEIGLDYLRLPKDNEKSSGIRSKQQGIFKQQLALARELDLPVIIHSRMAHKDLITILQVETKERGKVKGVVHCFTGSVQDAKEYQELGLYFGLNGIIFKMDLNEAISQMPLDKILLETDCPFLSPPGLPPRNSPLNLPVVAEKVAQIRNEQVNTIIEATAGNAQKLFKIKKIG